MNKRIFIFACLVCCMALVGCKKKDDLSSKDVTGYTFKMNDLSVYFSSKYSDNGYYGTVTTDYGSTATASRSSSSISLNWSSDTEATLYLVFEIGNSVQHVFQRENYTLKLNFASESAGTASGTDDYTRIWRNWGTSSYNIVTDLLYGKENITNEKFTLTK